MCELLDVQPPPGKTLDPRWHDVTIEHLLNHQGGWDCGRSFDPVFRVAEIAEELGQPGPASPADLLRYVAGQPLQFAPGSKTVYSNFGYVVLGLVIEKVSRQSYLDCVRQEIVGPLGITTVARGRSLPQDRHPREPAYRDAGQGRNVVRSADKELVAAPDGSFCLETISSAGGLIASAPDVARFLAAYQLNGEPVPAGPAEKRGSGEGPRHWRWQTGSLPGTFTLALERADGVLLVALFNQRTDPSGLDYQTLRGILEQVADRIEQWPAGEDF